jgi:predicted peptidase
MLFVSCADTNGTSSSDSDTSASDVSPKEEQNGIPIIKEDGKSDYTIIYDNTLDIYPSCQDLKAAIYNAYYVSMFPKKAAETPIGDYEILIGQTNRPESSQLQSSIGEDEYGIRLIGNKIVINSLTERGIKAAVKEFINMYVSSENKNMSIPADLNIVKKIPAEEVKVVAGWTFKSFKASNNTTLPYQLYMPENYDPAKEYPVILFMHGLGSVGNKGEHISQTVAQFVKNVAASNKYKNEVIILAPQHPSGQKWVEVNFTPGTYNFANTPISKWLAAAKELLDSCIEDYSIDENRIYGYGNSMGAFATIYMAMTYPDLYAAIVPVAGGCDPTKASLIKDVPIWLFHGDKDSTVNIIGSRTLYNNLISLGAKEAKLTVFQGVGHAAQGCFVAAANTNGLLDWMFSHSK